MGKEWIDWHADYDDATSSLAQRLQVVRRDLGGLLDKGPNILVSVCAGRGEDCGRSGVTGSTGDRRSKDGRHHVQVQRLTRRA